jgi:hypothetical protein
MTGMHVVMAQDTPDESVDSAQDGVVTYTASFFRRYQPNTALDMVQRVPGFTLDDGGDLRGFGGAAGNILINDRRPSTKQDSPSAILSRISADLVDRIELIRVKVRDIDLLGQTIVVNVIILENAPAAVRWEAFLRVNTDYGTTPYGSISLSDKWSDIEYNVGMDYRRTRYGDPGVIQRFDDSDVLFEIRDDLDRVKGYDLNGYFNASTWLGKNFVQLNSRAAKMPRDMMITSTRIPQLAGGETTTRIFDDNRHLNILELGVDGERVLRQDLLGKAILLYSHAGRDPSSSVLDLDASGSQTRFQDEIVKRVENEFISRLELDWAGITSHAIQFDIERAFNSLKSTLEATDDTGSGPVVVDVPGGNTRVEEVRWNFLIRDTWSLGKFDFEYGMTYESSTISQTGDANQERSFEYFKPRVVLTYSPERGKQTRLRVEREVSQLDFGDFVTTTVFTDNNVTLGNPELRPDRTWVAELSQEYRYGDIGVVKLTAFHHWIKDTLDFLPLSPTFEATGNIGDARRWGGIFETTIPLEWLRLTGARLDFKLRLQDSNVIDPVTGNGRVLSGQGGFRFDVTFNGENKYAVIVDFRQDLEDARVSWGWTFAERGERPLFKADELDIFNESIDLNAFIETTRWFGLKFAVEAQNILDNLQTRDRYIYTAGRELSPLLLRERREGDNGTRLVFKVSGTF